MFRITITALAFLILYSCGLMQDLWQPSDLLKAITGGLTIDTNAPVMAVTTPAHGSETPLSFTVTGTWSDNVNVDTITVFIESTNGTFTNSGAAAKETGAFSRPVTLSLPGVYAVWAVGIDLAGNRGCSATNVFTAVDIPVVDITDPYPGQAIGTNVQFNGTASGIGLCAVYISVSNHQGGIASPYSIADGLAGWRSNLVLAGSAGGYTYTLYAFVSNITGHCSPTNSVTFLVKNSLPNLNFMGPVNTGEFLATNTASIRISGDAGISAGTVTNVRIILSNSTVITDSADTFTPSAYINWEYNAALAPNITNTILAWAIGSSGETGSAKWIRVFSDTTPPVLSGVSVNPATNAITNGISFSVSGTVTDNYDNDGVFAVISNLTLGGAAGVYRLFTGNGAWNTNLTLAGTDPGMRYTLSLYAKDRTGNTSVHSAYPLLVRAFKVIYVSVSGSDAAAGDILAPVRSVQKGVDLAVSKGLTNVWVGAGTYTPGNGLNSSDVGLVITNNSISIQGSWNASYTLKFEMGATTSLNGNNSQKHVVKIVSVNWVSLRDMDIINGITSGSFPDNCGGGLYLSNVWSSALSNISAKYNSTSGTGYGGGLFLYHSHYNKIYNGNYSFNNASGDGGGILLYTSSYNTISGPNILNNTAPNIGGIGIVYYSSNNTVNGHIANNTNRGIVFMYSTKYNSLNPGSYYNNAIADYMTNE